MGVLESEELCTTLQRSSVSGSSAVGALSASETITRCAFASGSGRGSAASHASIVKLDPMSAAKSGREPTELEMSGENVQLGVVV